MGSAKRPRLDPLGAAIEGIGRMSVEKVAIYRPGPSSLPPLVEILREDIRPGSGLVGSDEEDAMFSQLPKKQGTNSTGDQRVDPSSQSSEPANGEGRGKGTENVGEDSSLNPPEQESSDEEDVEGVDEDLTDILMLPNGEMMHVSQYFGEEYADRIRYLHAVEPMACPDHMPTRPHLYQLKGAAQLDYLCQSPSRGGLLGDPMGLGKTLTTILHLWNIRHQPGESLVLCPASLCDQWVKAIEEAFDEGYGLTAIHYKDSSMSAHQLQAQGVDVVVASYEAYEHNQRAKQKTYEKVKDMKARSQDDASIIAKRPTCGLASDMRYYMWRPWKRVVLDEIQCLKSWDSIRHKAVMQISTEAIIGLSGTLPHNRWTDIGGYLDFIKGHPYTDEQRFLTQFTRGAYDTSRKRPSPAARTLLQRLFMAFTIIRPKDSLKLPPCRRVAFSLELPNCQADRVEALTDKYRYAAQIASNDTAAIGEREESSALGCAIQAQLHQLHPGLTPEADETYDPTQDITNVTAEELNNKFGNTLPKEDPRAKWIKELQSWSKERILESTHLTAVVDLVHHISVVLSQRVVVFSQYLRYLDLVDIGLRDRGIVAFRYDGTVSTSHRVKIQDTFQSPNNSRPILMTVGAGGIGLNLTAAKILILCEELWNENAIAQVIARLHRQGQEEEVLAIKFAVTNSAIDLEIVRVRETKVHINKDLFKPLIVRHDSQPTIPELLY